MILDNFAITDKVAIVTRAGQGIGRSIAIGLAEAGADVVVAARTTSDLDDVAARVAETGMRAFALLTKVAAQAMVDTTGGNSVVNISSRAADMVLTAFVAHGVGKAALTQMTRNLAAAFAPRVRINAIATGAVDTRALATVMQDEQMHRNLLERTPMQRAGTPEDIACAAPPLEPRPTR